MSIKRAFFWAHLIAGLTFGLFIGLLAFTGATIAYGPQLIEFSQRDITRIQIQDTPRLPLETLLKKAGEQVPGLSPAGVFVYAEPDRAVMIAGGRGKPSYYVNPYTGDTREQGAKTMRGFIQYMTGVHRFLTFTSSGEGRGEGPQRGGEAAARDGAGRGEGAMRGEGAARAEGAPGAGEGEARRGGEGPGRGNAGFFSRGTGKLVMDCAGLAFALICVTGLIIWWPRHLRWRAIKPSVWFMKGMKGKARDWNWHNVFGFWSLPIITTLAVTGAMIGFPWARALLYYAVGEKPPVRGEGRPGAGQQPQQQPAHSEAGTGETRREQPQGERRPQGGEGFRGETAAVTIAPPTPDAKPIGYDAAMAVATKDTPAWESVSFRITATAGAGRDGGRRFGGEGATAGEARRERRPEGDAPAGEGEERPRRRRSEEAGDTAAPAENRAPRAEGESGETRRGPRRRQSGATAITLTVKRSDTAPLFANVAYTLNPYTGEIVKKESFADKSAGEKLGGSVRNVHTGEAFGWFGQTLMFLACLATLVLAYTGFALSWRRFFPGKKKRHHQHRGENDETQPSAA